MPLRRLLYRLVLVVAFLVLGLIVRQWAYVTTYRLYLDRAVNARENSATQHFDIDRRLVVPSVVMRQAERLVFRNPTTEAVTARVDLDATAPANYVIASRRGRQRQILASGRVTARAAIATAVPANTEFLEVETDGPTAWIDLRLVRGMHVGRHVIGLFLLVLAWVVLNAGAPPREREAMRRACCRALALASTVLITLGACELTLRAAGNRAPSGVLAQRHDLGEVWPDERWEESPVYGRRLRANVETENAWQYGDIVRMGFISPAVSPAMQHRFPFKSDAEGFRNAVVRSRVDIAALGDSFTDALTVVADASWPARLEQQLGRHVQNYGTAGFGPQQELLVLQHYVVQHRPSTVVLAYFAGNDIFDAERFDRFEHAHGQPDAQTLGWQVKDTYSRADTWYVTSAVAASAGWIGRPPRRFVISAAAAEPAIDSAIHAAAPFDRGLFTVHAGGHSLQWAFMPPYLNLLNFSERELRNRQGWRFTRDAILAMQRTSREAGARFVVVFLPFKAQVYWPLIERSLRPEDLLSALDFYLKDNGRHIDVAAMHRNRLAQNTMMRQLCESSEIPFVDMTPVLEQRVEAGENVYFPDDSHLNETGLSTVADALARFLRAQ
jgi:lysophospholipase L1-like esterase